MNAHIITALEHKKFDLLQRCAKGEISSTSYRIQVGWTDDLIRREMLPPILEQSIVPVEQYMTKAIN